MREGHCSRIRLGHRHTCPVRAVLLGGAPGIGKSACARELLRLAENGPELVQWIDVDALWLHQPWRVDDAMKTMVARNLRAISAHANDAMVDVLVITWVFQDSAMHELVKDLLPPSCRTLRIQLLASEDVWATRFRTDRHRPDLDEFFVDRYAGAQATLADWYVQTDQLQCSDVAVQVATAIGLHDAKSAAEGEA